MSLLSANLSSKLIEDSLPWDRATQFSIRDFLDAYTLHDSDWITLKMDCGWDNSAVAVIRLDPVWNQSVSKPTSSCADWPLLFLRFTLVSNIQMAGFIDIGGHQRGISSVDVEQLSEEEAVTTIHDHYGASVCLRHFILVDVLVLSASEEVIQLPKRAV